MEQTADLYTLAGESVEQLDSLPGFQHVVLNPFLAQDLLSLGTNGKPLEHAAREDDDLCPVREKLIDIGGLDARIMPRSSLAPLPRPCPARPDLAVLEIGCAFSIRHFDSTPGNRADLHGRRHFQEDIN